MDNYDRPTSARDTDPRTNPAEAPPTSANQTVVRSGSGSTFIVVAVLAAILIVLFLAFGGGTFFGDGDTVVAPDGQDTLVVPEGDTNTTIAPAPDATAPAETAPATPDAEAPADTAPAAPEGETTTPAPAQ